MPASLSSSSDTIVVTRESMESADKRAVIQANIDFVNALYREYLEQSEISRDALRSYYVDYYLCEVLNGGFAQFVYNSSWNPETTALVKEGLQCIGAKRHASLFAEAEALVARRASKLASFFTSGFFGMNRERDQLNQLTSRFVATEAEEGIESLNTAWLKSHSGLIVVPQRELGEQIRKRVASISDLDVRRAAALEAEPRYMKIIRALCGATGQSLVRNTAADPSHQFEGRPVVAYHFITDSGHHYMIDLNDRAMMFVGTSNDKLLELKFGKDAI